jgi:hypothetical protein
MANAFRRPQAQASPVEGQAKAGAHNHGPMFCDEAARAVIPDRRAMRVDPESRAWLAS